MGRHSAPESHRGTASVVRLLARHGRSLNEPHDKVPAEAAASGAVVDDLTLITADDQLLDCIAAGQGDVFTMPHPFPAGFPAGSLAPLLATWRSQIVDPQWPAMPTAEQAQKAVRADRRAVVKHTKRAMGPMLGVAIAISALLFGSAAAGAQSAKPGDALWPLARVLYAERADSYAASEAADRSLKRADAALSSGNMTRAVMALTAAHREMDKVKLAELTSVRQSLELDYETLMSRASGADTASAQSSAQQIAAASRSANEAITFPGSGTTSVKPTPSGGSTGRTFNTGSSGTAPSRPSIPGAPVTQNPSRPSTPGGATAAAAPPLNPVDPVTTSTAPTGPGTSTASNPPIPTAPGTTAPGTTDPGTTPATSRPVTTAPSTTSLLPAPPTTAPTSTTPPPTTPTPTAPAPTTPNAGANVGSIPSDPVASP